MMYNKKRKIEVENNYMNKIKNSKDILYRVEKNFPIPGVNFIDLTPTLTEPGYFKIIAEQLKTKILDTTKDFDYIISPDARGFIWGAYLAALLEKPFIPIRKHGKLPASSIMSTIEDKTEYSNIQLDIPIANLENKKCIFIDDVYATGGTYKACKQLVETNNGILNDAYVILDILLTDDKVNALITANDLEIN